MQCSPQTDHPERYPLTHELHARPFQPVAAPGRVLHVAFKDPANPTRRDPEFDRAHLLSFIDRHGGPHPPPAANHYSHDFGRFVLKWEQHTEFVSYTIFEAGPGDALYSRKLAELFPQEWVDAAPGKIIAACEIEIIMVDDTDAAREEMGQNLLRYFVGESMVVSYVLDGAGTAAADFHIHEDGFSRFALVLHKDVAARRIGQVVQRFIEIDTYRVLAMLALPLARKTAARLNEIEQDLTHLVELVASKVDDKRPDPEASASAILNQLSAVSAEIEEIATATAFRFGASFAYERIVRNRIEVLREGRVPGLQLFREFMLRRFDPAMQTCHAADRRLHDLSIRASRIAQLLHTRVDVEMEDQNQALLRSMDRRSDLQLRLQRTVEGLSVVAISYYAAGLATYILLPVGKLVGLDKATLTALVTVPTIAFVVLLSRRLRKHLE